MLFTKVENNIRRMRKFLDLCEEAVRTADALQEVLESLKRVSKDVNQVLQ